MKTNNRSASSTDRAVDDRENIGFVKDLTVEDREKIGLVDDGRDLPMVAPVTQLLQHKAEQGGSPVLPGELDERAPPAVVSLHGR